LLAEARKLGVSVVSANQYLEQYEGSMRAAVLSIGTQLLFQLGASDAERMSRALGGGKFLRERLANLPQRELIAKIGGTLYEHVRVPELGHPNMLRVRGLLSRSNRHFARLRSEVEAEIQSRGAGQEKNLDAWA
jgi:hypothetical protein